MLSNAHLHWTHTLSGTNLLDRSPWLSRGPHHPWQQLGLSQNCLSHCQLMLGFQVTTPEIPLYFHSQFHAMNILTDTTPETAYWPAYMNSSASWAKKPKIQKFKTLINIVGLVKYLEKWSSRRDWISLFTITHTTIHSLASNGLTLTGCIHCQTAHWIP